MAGRSPRRYALLLCAALLSLMCIGAGASSAPPPPRSTAAPVISGTARVADELSASRGKWRPKPAKYQHRWQVKKTVIKKVRVKRKGRVRVVKRTVITWPPATRATARTFTPAASLKGKQVRACVRARAKGASARWSAWACSRPTATIGAAADASGAGASGGSPAPAAPAAEPPALSLAYGASTLVSSQSSQQVTPTVSGGAGTRVFSRTGALPDGVTFDAASGTFTGPTASGWNFRATQIAAGASHTCAVTAVGGVRCWGTGTSGRLGNGGTGDQSTPVDVRSSAADASPLTGVSAVVAGDAHTCVLMTSGAVKCWGQGQFGRLGNGQVANATAPVDVVGVGQSSGGTPLTGIRSLSAGARHTCAVTTGSGVACWGDGQSGQRGDGTTLDADAPAMVTGWTADLGGPGQVVQVVAGDEYTCALLTGGAVACWGFGADGEMGNGAATSHLLPVRVIGVGGGRDARAVQISAGSLHVCARTAGGGVKCWGGGGQGQIGNGSSVDATSAEDVVGVGGVSTLTGVAEVAAGGDETCARTTGGAVRCWGAGTRGQLGDGTTTSVQNTPVPVTGAAEVGSLAVGGQHACATDADGGVQCWGYNAGGQLGDGGTANQTTPVATRTSGPQAGFPATITVGVTDGVRSAGTSVTLTEASAPRVRYGADHFGVGSASQQITPTVGGGSGTPTFAFSGTLPTGVSFNASTGTFTGPLASDWGERVTQVVSGYDHACALTTGGTVKCWGNNDSGQLGDGTYPAVRNSPAPVDVAGFGTGTLSGVVQIAAGGENTCAVLVAGRVACWGRSNFGVIGNNTTINSGVASVQATPAYVHTSADDSTPLGEVTQVSVSFYSACAVASGGVKCWGWNGAGQLGDNTTTNRPTPVSVVGVGASGTLSGIAQVAVGTAHACARTSGGEMRCWGDNNSGKLGNDDLTETDTSTPVNVVASSGDPTVLTAVAQMTAGDEHTCAATISGGGKCWGRTAEGAVGDGRGAGLIGNGDPTPEVAPVSVLGIGEAFGGSPLTGVSGLSAGFAHTCALMSDSSVTCWGRAAYGRLGNGTATPSLAAPAAVVGVGATGQLSGASMVAGGQRHTCAASTLGGVWCWGDWNWGQLGDGREDSPGFANQTQSSPVETAPTVLRGQPGFPFSGTVTVTDDLGATTFPGVGFAAW